jgi:glutaminase
MLNAHKIKTKIYCNELDNEMLSCGIYTNMLQIKYKVGLCAIEWVTFGQVS